MGTFFSIIVIIIIVFSIVLALIHYGSIKRIKHFLGRLCLVVLPQSKLAQTPLWEKNIAAGLKAYQRNDCQKAEEKFKAALMAAENFEPTDLHLPMSLSNLAELYSVQDRHAEAEAFQERALAILEKARIADKTRYSGGRPVGPNLHRAFNKLVRLYCIQEKYAAAEVLLRRRLAMEDDVLWFHGLEVPEIFFNLATVYHKQGRIEKAEPLFRLVLESWEGEVGLNHPNLIMDLENLAAIYQTQGQNDKAKRLINKVSAIRERIIGSESCWKSIHKGEVAEFYNAKGHYGDEKEMLSEQVLAAKENALRPDHPDIKEGLIDLERLYQTEWPYSDEWKHREAASLNLQAVPIRQTPLEKDDPKFADSLDAPPSKKDLLSTLPLKIREKARSPDHPDIAKSLIESSHNYGHFPDVDDQGRKRDSKRFPFLIRALAIQEKTLGLEHLDVAETLEQLACLHDLHERNDKEELLYERALAIREKVHGSEHPKVARNFAKLANSCRKQEKYAKTVLHYKRLLTIIVKFLGPEHPDVAKSLYKLAEVYCILGEYRYAELLFKRTLAIWEKAGGADYVNTKYQPDVVASLSRLTDIYHRQDKDNEAEKLLLRDLAIIDKFIELDDPKAGSTLESLAKIYHKQGRHDEAQPLYERLITIWKKTRWLVHPPPDVPKTITKLADIYREQGRLKKAEPLYKHSLVLWDNILRLRHSVEVRKNIDEPLIGLFDSKMWAAVSHPLPEQSLEHLHKAIEPEREHIVQTLENYSLLLRNIGRDAEAERLEIEVKSIRARQTEEFKDQGPEPTC